MARNSDRKKRQTRLTFSPLAPSDPARASQPLAVRDRAAAVTLDISPGVRRNKPVGQNPLPTPRKSSQNEHGLGSSPLRPRTRSSFMAGGDVTSTPISKKSSRGTLLEVPDDSESDASVKEHLGSSQVPQSSRKRVLPYDESESEDMVWRSHKRRKHNTKAPHKNAIVVDDSGSGEIDNRPLDSESDQSIRRRTRSKKRSLQVESSAESRTGLVPTASEEVVDEDDEPPRSARRKKSSRGDETPPRTSLRKQDRNDLDEDLDFLKSSDTPSITRRTASSKVNAKQKALEALKKRRLKQQNSSQSSNTRRHLANDSDDHFDNDDDSEGDDDDTHDVDAGLALDSNGSDMDQNDEDFVVEDDEGVLGAPVELPIEFSRFQTMKAAELFKYAVEWMVQKKINPAFEIKDSLYRISFTRLDDFVKGMGGSKFQSSVWVPAFIRSLRTRPVIENNRFADIGLLHGRCDACNRSGHPATWEVCFTGNTYDRETLEEDSEDDSDEGSVSEEQLTYYIGKFCMQNARTAHALAHWRYHLNQWVVDYLNAEGYLTPEKIVERDGWSVRKRSKHANKIVDKMEDSGEIKRLYRDFRHETSTAQFANIDD